MLLDNYAQKEHREKIELFKEKFYLLQELKKQLETLLKQAETARQQHELITFQVNEIEAAAVEDAEECEKLEHGN